MEIEKLRQKKLFGLFWEHLPALDLEFVVNMIQLTYYVTLDLIKHHRTPYTLPLMFLCYIPRQSTVAHCCRYNKQQDFVQSKLRQYAQPTPCLVTSKVFLPVYPTLLNDM
ncbi:hypothetical protein Hanom_Chr16g01416221 [Helianthus anomalus]